MCWVKFSPVPVLLVLMQGNKIFMLQNDLLKKIIDIDTANLNLVEIKVQEQGKSDSDDIFGLNVILDDIKYIPKILFIHSFIHLFYKL